MKSRQAKHLKHHLIKNSIKLFLLFILSSMMIISMYDNNATWQSLVVRSVSICIISLAIFFTNIYIMTYFYTSSQPKPVRNIDKKIFALGYTAAVIIFTLYNSAIVYCSKLGVELYLPQPLENTTAWKLVVFSLYASLVHYSFIYLIQYFTYSQYEKNRVELELLKLKSANTETTNRLLKQQIKPHFLFNALNTLKSLIKKQPDLAEHYLLTLAEFLRASFADKSSSLSIIYDEIEICNNYMEMQQIRFGNSIQYIVNIPENDEVLKKYVPFFSLQPLLENAIKHNIATTENPLIITIEKDEKHLIIKNNLQFRHSIEDSNGNGLSNLKERYRMLASEDVIINIDKQTFSVSIKILNKNGNSNY